MIKRQLLKSSLGVALAGIATTASEKGALKGAAVGASAGHVPRHHAVAGAAVGSAFGHQRANKASKLQYTAGARSGWAGLTPPSLKCSGLEALYCAWNSRSLVKTEGLKRDVSPEPRTSLEDDRTICRSRGCPFALKFSALHPQPGNAGESSSDAQAPQGHWLGKAWR
jgi:hypothetical protein